MTDALATPTPGRRHFLGQAVLAGAGLALGPSFWRAALAAPAVAGEGPYGSIAGRPPDANGLILPPGFRSRVIARTGERVGPSGYVWHSAPDGGATFPTEGGGWVYVSNSETLAELGAGASAVRFGANGEVVDAYRILEGTNANCAGGPTPWGTWLSCEEYDLIDEANPSPGPPLAGQVWECDPSGVTPGVALPVLGRFSHEAAAVDPATNRIYLTEDKGDSLFYRFTPDRPAPGRRPDLTRGVLEAMVVDDPDAVLGAGSGVRWAPVPDPGALTAPTRRQVPEATRFQRGEGAWYDSGVVYFCTTGDDRVWAYDTGRRWLSVVYDLATTPDPPLEDPDNVTVHPRSGELFVAEDDGDLELVVITPPDRRAQRTVTSFMRITGQSGTEVAGPAFDPSGTRLYFSSQRGIDAGRGITYEVQGPFRTGSPRSPRRPSRS